MQGVDMNIFAEVGRGCQGVYIYLRRVVGPGRGGGGIQYYFSNFIPECENVYTIASAKMC